MYIIKKMNKMLDYCLSVLVRILISIGFIIMFCVFSVALFPICIIYYIFIDTLNTNNNIANDTKDKTEYVDSDDID